MKKEYEQFIEEFLNKIYEQGYKAGQESVKRNDRDYQDGKADGRMETWNCVRKIMSCKQGDICKIFPEKDYDDYDMDWLNDYSVSEVIALVREYEENQNLTEDKIKVGDEVLNDVANHKYRGVVIGLGQDVVKILWENYDVTEWKVSSVEKIKTGKNYSNLEETMNFLKERNSND